VAAKSSVLGVLVDAVDYDDDAAGVLAAAREHRPFGLTALAVHGVMTGVTDAGHQARLTSFDMVTADGQPVRWALNLLQVLDCRLGQRPRNWSCGTCLGWRGRACRSISTVRPGDPGRHHRRRWTA
jgi:hypothetical protein